jgi:hypothetical protein
LVCITVRQNLLPVWVAKPMSSVSIVSGYTTSLAKTDILFFKIRFFNVTLQLTILEKGRQLSFGTEIILENAIISYQFITPPLMWPTVPHFQGDLHLDENASG